VKVITRIKGGIGNQLFCYAAARRLALVNSAELVIDNLTGFVRDVLYARHYMLDYFAIPVRKATKLERMEPFERYHRGIAKFIARTKPFYLRNYIEQEGLNFDSRLLDFKVKGDLYLDGYWQSESYFKDVEQTIRKDLEIIIPKDDANSSMAGKICQSTAIAVHVRWFDAAHCGNLHSNVSIDYYKQAMSQMKKRFKKLHFFLFSDDPVAAQKIGLSKEEVTYVNHNLGDKNAYADLWLMSLCKHFIIANSTFSWWGAWLSQNHGKVIIAPKKWFKNPLINTKDLIPACWLRL